MKFAKLNNLDERGELLKDVVNTNLQRIDLKIRADGLKVPLGNGSELLLAAFNNPKFAKLKMPTSVFTSNGPKKLTRPIDRSYYYVLEGRTFQIRALLSTNLMLGWIVVNLLHYPARVLSKSISFVYKGNLYTPQHRNGQILAKALLTNTNPELVALLER